MEGRPRDQKLARLRESQCFDALICTSRGRRSLRIYSLRRVYRFHVLDIHLVDNHYALLYRPLGGIRRSNGLNATCNQIRCSLVDHVTLDPERHRIHAYLIALWDINASLSMEAPLPAGCLTSMPEKGGTLFTCPEPYLPYLYQAPPPGPGIIRTQIRTSANNFSGV